MMKSCGRAGRGQFYQGKIPTTGRRKELKQSGFSPAYGFLLKQLLTVKRGRGMMAAWYADMGRESLWLEKLPA